MDPMNIGGKPVFGKYTKETINALETRVSGKGSVREPVAWRLRKGDVDYGITSYDPVMVDIYLKDGWELVQKLYAE